MSLTLPDLQKNTTNSAVEAVCSSSNDRFSMDPSLVALFTALAVLPVVATASAAPAATSASLANSSTRRIKFIPTIDGAHPENPEPLPERVGVHDFPDLESANAHLKALHKAHKSLIASLKARAIFDSTISSHMTANTSSKKTYSNGILGNREIEPVVFIFTVQGTYLRPNRPTLIANFHTAAEAYDYTMRLAKIHRALLDRAAQRNAVLQNAPIPVASTQISQNDVVPQAASASAIALEPAAQNNRREEDFDEKESDYMKKEVVGPSGTRMITESWLTGTQTPPLIPGGVDPITYAEDNHSYRLTIVPPPNSTTAPAPESPSPPLSPASMTPPRSPSPAQNGTAAASNVTTNQTEVEAGCLLITQEWPAEEGDPGYPEVPKGYELRNVTEDKAGNARIRTLLLQEIALPVPPVEEPD